MTNRIVTGTSFPGSPVDTQDFFRTDLGLWCYYDLANTRWLTTNVYQWQFAEVTLSATSGALGRTWIGAQYQPAWIRHELRTNVATTNNGTDFWSFTLRSSSLDKTTTNIRAGISTGGTPDTAGVETDHGATISSTPANYGDIHIIATKNASPGNVTFSSSAQYRFIIT